MFQRIRQAIYSRYKVCPKTGKIRGIKTGEKRAFWLWFITGLAALIWVLIRVVPKPSRAAYPCQRVATPIAAGFLAGLVGLVGGSFFLQKAHRLIKNKRYILGILFFATALSVSFFALNDISDAAASTEEFVPTDPANSPMGTARGIMPGRVVWVYDEMLSDQGSTDGFWWTDERTDPEVAKRMMTHAIVQTTGITDPVKAWDALFKHFNEKRYEVADRGYQAGDKIAIKVNNIYSRAYEWSSSQDNRPSPQMMHALLWNLIYVAGVPEEDITFYDCIFYHGDPVYNYCHDAYPGVRWAEGDATDRSGYETGPGSNPGTREKVVADPECVVHYSDTEIVPGSGTVCLPTVVSEARYLMNIALPRPHDLAGVTFAAKNFFGSVYHPTVYGYYHHWHPEFMHKAVAAREFSADIPQRPMGSYNALVDLMGHEELGGKVVLFLSECIRYRYWSAPPFNGGPASSIFMSQDFVAFESVLLDFLRSEKAVRTGTVDNYLHEASQANNPPSGTVYDPENDGTPLKSLGVHEHWNNSTDKQYSRNLGSGEGIELIQVVNDTTTYQITHTGIENHTDGLYNGFSLKANYPNPFQNYTTIAYSLNQDAMVQIDIFNLKGQKVKTLVSASHSPGDYQIEWNGTDDSSSKLEPGIYAYRMLISNENGSFSKSRQLLKQ